MKLVPITILIALALALSGCQENRKPPPRRRDDAKAAEIARLKDEMERRVREARDEHLLRAARLRTIRITAFVLLTGGAVTWFILIHRPARNWPSGSSMNSTASTRPQWSDHIPAANEQGRVFDMPQASGPAEDHPTTRPRRRHKRRHGRNPRHHTHP